MAIVYLDSNDSPERALKKFKRVVEREGIIKECRQREYYEKPSLIRVREEKIARRKMIKKMEKINNYLSSN